MLLARLTVLLLGLYAVLGQRLVIGTDTGGRGVVSPLEIAFVLSATLLWSHMAWRGWARRGPTLWLPTIGPLFVVLLLLPFGAVLLAGYELRAFYTWVVVLVPLGILTLGRAARTYGIDLRRVAYAAVLAHGLYGLGQLLFRLDIVPAGLWSSAAQWDMASQETFSEAYLVAGRSTGLFVSPNQFGLWSVLAVIFGWCYLRRLARVACVGLGALGVLGSQSRTAALVLALLSAIVVVIAATSVRRTQSALIAIAWAAPAVGLLALFGVFQGLVESDLTTRLDSGVRVLSQGVQADANVATRTEVFSRASDFAATQYPFGTLGPPQVFFPTFVDNQYISLYLQGTIVLVLLYLLALCGPFTLLHRKVPGAGHLFTFSLTMAIFSATMLPLDSPQATALLWLAVALTLAGRDREAQPGGSGESANGSLAGEHRVPSAVIPKRGPVQLGVVVARPYV